MKTELQLLEECIEAKTKEYQLAMLEGKANTPWSSFANVQSLVARREQIDQLKVELEQLKAWREQLLGDFCEEEQILGSKEEVMQRLSELPDGAYKLIKIERKDNAQ